MRYEGGVGVYGYIASTFRKSFEELPATPKSLAQPVEISLRRAALVVLGHPLTQELSISPGERSSVEYETVAEKIGAEVLA